MGHNKIIAMKKIILLLVTVCAHHYANAQSTDDLSGRYYDESGVCFEINKDQFKLTTHLSPLPAIWEMEVMASGTVERIDNSLIELNSYETPATTVARDLKIIRTTEIEPQDSIEIKFSIPFKSLPKYSKLNITLFPGNISPYNKECSFDYSMTNTTIRVPNTVKSFSLYIVPEWLFPHTSMGAFYGIMTFYSFEEYIVGEGINHIEIEIPVMDLDFFQRYYVVGEYARVTENSITWKGVTYRKVTGRELKKRVRWEREEKERREQIEAGMKGK